MDHLLWVDMEMTGLDVEKEVPIEIAAIVTNKKLEILDTYQAVINQPQKFLDSMDDWNKKHHQDSGLAQLIPSGKPPSVVEADLLSLLDQHWIEEKAVLAGNSIFQDRVFLNKYFQRFSERLHYRMLDVTAFKLVFNNFFGQVFKKKNGHRAIDDIQESISEFSFYLKLIEKDLDRI